MGYWTNKKSEENAQMLGWRTRLFRLGLARPGDGGVNPPLQNRGSGGPEDVELFFDVGEVFVAGGERGFAMGSEGGGKAIGIRQFVLRPQFGGAASQFEIGVHDFQRELCNVFQDFPRDAGALGAPRGVIHFAPIHHGHQQLALAFDAQANQILDLVRAGTVFKEGHQGAGVKDDTFHSSGRVMNSRRFRAPQSSRSRLRSSSRALRADGSPLSEPRRLRINAAVRGCNTKRFSCSRKATWVPSLIEYLRRSFEGMTSWPFVVTVETSVFMRTPSPRIPDKYAILDYVTQHQLWLTFGFMAAATRGGEIPHIRRTTVSSRKSLRDGEERTRVKGKKKSACCVRSRKTIRDANDANDGVGMRPCCPASSPVTGVCVWRCGRRRRGRWRFCLRRGERRSEPRRRRRR